MRNGLRTAVMLLVLAGLNTVCAADDVYYTVPVGNLALTEGKLPAPQPDFEGSVNWQMSEAVRPYVVVDRGEGYLASADGATPSYSMVRNWSDSRVYIRAIDNGPVTGILVLPNEDFRGMQRVRFRVPDGTAPCKPAQFLTAKLEYYQSLRRDGMEGAAWFRYQENLTSKELGISPSAEPGMIWQMRQREELDETYDLFTGGRAVSENLQLDRVLPSSTQPAAESVALSSLEGITIAEMDWASRIKDLHPQLDPLAVMIPADQHAVFFPTFNAAVALIDEAERQGSWLLVASDSGNGDARSQDRYQRQLCLSLSGLGRLLGPSMIDSVAVTGSDPYLRVGSDVAVLFEAANPAVLTQLLTAQIELGRQANPAAKPVEGEVLGVAYSGAVSPDRRVCSYMATVGQAVVVTNSLAQLQRIITTQQGKTPALASAPEYTFFRDRYRRDQPDETALLVLTDAAIRRWCSPQWRIADSRRTRAAAILSDLQARYGLELADGRAQPGPVSTDRSVPQIGTLQLAPEGVVSSTYGSLAFMTPIVELPIDHVTQSEADAYRRWRSTYQQNWRWFFDPIAVRFTVRPRKLAIDLTVMPLIAGSDYRQIVDVTSGASLSATSGDPHDAIGQVALAINPDSPTMRGLGHTIQTFSGNLRIEPLAWVGGAVALYADDDPFWRELIAAADPEKFFQGNLPRLPVAVYAQSRDALRLAAFLTAVHAYIDQSAPGLTQWQTLSFDDQPYVAVRAVGDVPEELAHVALYYAATPHALVVSVNEDVLKRAIARQRQRSGASTKPSEPVASIAGAPPAAAAPAATQPAVRPWLGTSLCLQLDQRLIDVIGHVTATEAVSAAQVQAWRNIPILNEWRRLLPDQDPVAVHEKLFGVRLVDPAGGTYTWNEQWQTMESVNYGHPGQQKAGPAVTAALKGISANFGLSLEDKGLRGRVEVEREPAAAP